MSCKGVSRAPASPSTGHAGALARCCGRERRRRRPWTRPPGRALSLVVPTVERRRPVALALGLAGEVDAVGVVDDAVEHGVERMAALAGSEGLAAEPRARLEEIVGQYRAHAAARERVRGLLRDVDRHWLRYRTISRRARDLDVRPRELRSWPIWLERNERLLREGRAILDDPATYRAHLDRIEDGRERLRTEVSRLERFSSAYRTQSRSRDRGRSWSM